MLLAGFAAGTAYGRSYARFGWLFAGADVLRRAWTLYIAHIFLFVVFSAQVSYSATALDRSDYLDEIHLDVLAEAPYRAMLEALLLSFQPAYLNILPMYIALLCLFALMLPLLEPPLAARRPVLRPLRRGTDIRLEPSVLDRWRLVLQPVGLAVPLLHRRDRGAED